MRIAHGRFVGILLRLQIHRHIVRKMHSQIFKEFQHEICLIGTKNMVTRVTVCERAFFIISFSSRVLLSMKRNLKSKPGEIPEVMMVAAWHLSCSCHAHFK